MAIWHATRILVLAAAVSSAPVARADESAALTPERAVGIALAGNPGLARAHARAQAMAEVPPQVGALPDPTLSLNALNFPTDTFSQSQEAMTQVQLGVGVTLPFPGKLALREQAAAFEAGAAGFDADEARLMLVRNVCSTWWNLFYLDRAVSLVQRNRELLRQFVRIAESKYETGQGMQSDVLLAQVELSRLQETGIGLEAARRGQAAALNALLGRDAAEPVELPVTADESLPVAPDFVALREAAAAARPALSAQRAALDAARAREALAEKDYYPDFRLGAAYGVRNGLNPNGSARADMASLTLSVNLPLFAGAKQDRALSQRRAEVQQGQYGLEDRVAQVDAEIQQALADYRAAREQALLFKTGIVPQASQTAAAMLAAYRVDRVDFLNLVRAQITLYNYESQYWKALSSGWQARARLEAATGTSLPEAVPQTDKEKMHESE